MSGRGWSGTGSGIASPVATSCTGSYEGGRVVGGTGAHTTRTKAADGIEIGYWLSATRRAGA